MDHEIKQRLDAAYQFAVLAGKSTLDFFCADDLEVEIKSDGSPLTKADQGAERLLRERISDQFPHDGIVGEEFGESEGSNDFRWVLDPIDGTKSFVCGVPLYGTMIGIERAGEAVIGSIYFPGLSEGMFAGIGGGAWHYRGDREPRRTSVSNKNRLEDAVLLTTDVPRFKKRDAHQQFDALSRQVYLSRTWGDVYGYLLVASARADIMIDPIMNVWDACALLPIVNEAGGRFTDWQGQSRVDGGDGIGTNGHLHDAVLNALNSASVA
ncbi:MAG: histidinol-phosphatase [Pirellulaceae bacterium]